MFKSYSELNMFGPQMEEEVMRNLEPQTDVGAQQQAFEYLEQLKNSEVGWQFCMNTLTNARRRNNQLNFFCFQVMEHYIKNHYNNENVNERQRLRAFLCCWIQLQCSNQENREPSFLLNKAAQIFALAFVCDYPVRWPEFFDDLIETLTLGPQAADIYIRVLKAVVSEVTDLDIIRTQQEIERNSAIKNAMRGSCVAKIVNSWYHILTTYETSHVEIVNLCLEIIGAYVSWIDITLVANERFVQVLLSLLRTVESREYVVDCLYDIVNKGMEPMDKHKLIESLVTCLQESNFLSPLKDDETEFSVKLSRLVNGIGINLIEAYNKLLKGDNSIQISLLQSSIESKIPLMLTFLGNDYDDVSAAVLDFAREYLHMLKGKVLPTQVQLNFVQSTLVTLVHKMKYDESYRFDQQGEDEATFLEFRKQLKVLFDNIAGVYKDVVIEYVSKYSTNILSNWRTLPFQDVELAIHLLYLMGEAIPATNGNHFIGTDQNKVTAMQTMVHILITSDVSHHPHPAVKVPYIETVVRYEKFFYAEPEHIPYVLTVFLDQRGMRNEAPVVRSRCAYLFSRFVKCLRSLIQPYVQEVLEPLQYLLVLIPPGTEATIISDDDQLYLYEAASVMIISGAFGAQQKGMVISNMLCPVIEKFKTMVSQLMVETDEEKQKLLAQSLCHAMAVTSRASKAFSNHQSMKSFCCVPIFVEATKVFINCLQVPNNQSPVLKAGVRQFLHRMVVCLEEELLAYIPQASLGLLEGNNDARSVQEFVPLIVQIISKFRKEVVPVLHQVFLPLVNSVFTILATKVDENDEQAKRDHQLLQRYYYQFISAVVTNNLFEVLNAQDSIFIMQMMTGIVQGIVDFSDPVAQRTCFGILRKLVDVWGGTGYPDDFTNFVFKNIVPACFIAPLRPSFDLTDAHTILALAENAMCMKCILHKYGNDLVNYLREDCLPKLEISPRLIEEYCLALKADDKTFKNYIKEFFQQART